MYSASEVDGPHLLITHQLKYFLFFSLVLTRIEVGFPHAATRVAAGI